MSQLVDRAASSSVALVVDGRSVTYQRLAERRDALVELLRRMALEPGDRFAFLLPNGLALVCAYLASARAGLVAVPLSARLSPAELEFELRDAAPAAVLHASEYGSLIEPVVDRLSRPPTLVRLAGVSDWPDPVASASQRHPVPVSPTDAFAVMYTGGTTGAAKAAVQSHAAWSRSVLNVAAEWGLRPTDRHVCVLAMSHVSWFTTAAHLWAGASCWLTQRWNPAEVLDLIERVGITTLNVIPTMLSDLVAEAERKPRDVHSLRLLTVAGSPLPPDLYLRARAVFGPVIRHHLRHDGDLRPGLLPAAG
ncbi:MAG: hypothetical protein NVSMB13_02650 [Mycobacteriales bacterium]